MLQINFKAVVSRKPTKDMKATLRAVAKGVLTRSSPRSAPMNGPKISPRGQKKKPIMRPAVAPRIPAFVPFPNFVSHTGATQSKIVMSIIKIPITTSVAVETSSRLYSHIIQRVMQESGGPGRAGTMAPTKPMMAKIAPRIKKMYSMFFKSTEYRVQSTEYNSVRD